MPKTTSKVLFTLDIVSWCPLLLCYSTIEYLDDIFKINH